MCQGERKKKQVLTGDKSNSEANFWENIIQILKSVLLYKHSDP